LKVNPLSYGLAFAAAILWAAYCSVTVKTSQGKNLVTIFFALVAVVLWIKYFFMSGSAINFTYDNTVTLIMAAGALGLGYGAWNIGIISGNMTLMAGASYFTPVLSAFCGITSKYFLIFHLLARCCNGDNRSSLVLVSDSKAINYLEVLKLT
jgi:drug/metabolite transporter (DMT)-like permease